MAVDALLDPLPLRWVFTRYPDEGDGWRVGVALQVAGPDGKDPAIVIRHLFAAANLETADKVLRRLGATRDPRRALAKVLLLEPGAWCGDLLAVLEDGDEDALARVVDGRRVDPRDPAAKREWSRRVEAAGGFEDARRELLPTALFLALQRADEPQRIRRGREYVVASDGKPAKLIPSKLDLVETFPWWLEKELRNAAEEILTDGRPRQLVPDDYQTSEGTLKGYRPIEVAFPAPPVEGETAREDGDDTGPGSASWLDASREPGPEELLLLAEGEAEGHELLTSLREQASPRERQILGLVAAGLSVREAARRMGIAEGTALSLWGRLRKKAAKMLTGV